VQNGSATPTKPESSSTRCQRGPSSRDGIPAVAPAAGQTKERCRGGVGALDAWLRSRRLQLRDRPHEVPRDESHLPAGSGRNWPRPRDDRANTTNSSTWTAAGGGCWRHHHTAMGT
jgi:hypothetical protein